MKKYMIATILSLAFLSMHAQLFVEGVELTPENAGKYMVLQVGRGVGSSQIRVIVDYGQAKRLNERQVLTDSKGETSYFNNMVNALNFFDENGWEVAQVYVVGDPLAQTTNYLLKRKE